MPKNVLLLDADQFAYRCGFACERAYDWGDGTITKVADAKEIAQAIEEMVAIAKKDTGLDLVYFGLSSEENFRRKIWPEYKANRDPRKKPVGLRSALDYIERTYPTLKHHGLEADDILGVKQLMLQTMMGDPTDNFKGIEGFGPKKAEKALERNGYTWHYVGEAFLLCGYTLDYMTRMAKLARICRKVSDKDRWFPLGGSMKELNNAMKEDF
jgi:DNA polymerase-1